MQIPSRQTEAGAALVTSGLIEDWLEKLLLTAGRPLSNKTAKGIFAALGPLSSFSAKIEIAYTFELIDKAVRDDLRIIRGFTRPKRLGNSANVPRRTPPRYKDLARFARRLIACSPG
jgi:hypothetical protein